MKSKNLMLITVMTGAVLVQAQSSWMSPSNKTLLLHNQIIPTQPPSAESNIVPTILTTSPPNSSAIVIDYTNNLVPVEAFDGNFFTFDQPIPVPQQGPNQTYDFGELAFEAENFVTNILVHPPDPSMLSDRTAYLIPENILDFNGLLVDSLFVVYATNDQGLYITQLHFTSAKCSLEPITGIVTDSLIIPEQTVVLPEASLVQKYPTTSNTQWLQNPGKSGPTVYISLASEGLDHAPVQLLHEHKFSHKIVGWGKIRVPTPTGPSDYLECLLDKVIGPDFLTILVNGVPASEAVSTIFTGNPHHKQVTYVNLYQFLKQGFWATGAEAVLVMDPTFSTAFFAIFDVTYLDIYCENGVNMCLEDETDCYPYANNEANTAMLEYGATLGYCDGETPEINQPGVDFPEHNLHSSDITFEIYPNPIQTFAAISLYLPESTDVSLSVFDMTGRLVNILAHAQFEAGIHQFTWDVLDEKGKEVRSGTYFIKLVSGDRIETKKISVTK